MRLPRTGGTNVAEGAGWISPVAITEGLQALGLTHLLVEGGGITISGFLEAGLLDRLHVGIAPLIIGAGPMSLTTPNPVQNLSEAMRPRTVSYALGSDLMVDCDIAGTRRAQSSAPAQRSAPPEPATLPKAAARRA